MKSISFGTFILKLLAGLFGGALGSVILIFIFVIASSVLTPLTDPNVATDYISPVFIFLLTVMVFISSTVGNILATFFLSLTEKDKYTKISSTIYQIFIASLLVFIFMIPVYFISSSNMQMAIFTVALHLIISAQVSALILEIISNHKYSLVGVYSVTFSIILSAAAMFGLYNLVDTPSILLFAALPIVWFSYAFVYGVFTMLYAWIADTYDKDFLSVETEYGSDYGREVVEKVEPKAKDEKGADFLRNN
jgi:hypothetical protein